ncbi:MAG: hypothetical protein HQM09_19835 [Candidatus Riflebacteria bacterium]|nr:hypothetical protein [Candidatus Riflebacteria bacterium]
MKRHFAILVVSLCALLIVGCGGGGGGSNPAASSNTNTNANTVTVTGNVDISNLASLRSQATASGFTIGVGSSRSSIKTDGTFSVAVPYTGAVIDLDVRNAQNAIRSMKRINNAENGKTIAVDGIIGSQSMGILLFILKSATAADAAVMTEKDVLAQVSAADMQALAASITVWLKVAGNATKNITDDAAIPLPVVALKPGEQNIRDNYAAMKKTFENNTLDSLARTQAFLTFIDTGFLDIAGVPNYQDLASSSQSRFDRYTVNSYSFSLKELRYTASDTIEAATSMYINVTRKPGAEGGVAAAEIYVTPDPKIVWKIRDGVWRIYQGLPYKSSELSI